jgi:hypothetical protein
LVHRRRRFPRDGREPRAGRARIQRAITHNLAAKLRVLNATVREHAAQEDRPVREAAPQADPLADVPRTRRASFDWRKFLPLLSFFDGFDEDETDEFVAAAQVLELGRGAWIFAQGQPAQYCYLVVRGAARGARAKGLPRAPHRDRRTR